MGQAIAKCKILWRFHILIEVWLTWGIHLSNTLNYTLEICASQYKNTIPRKDGTSTIITLILLLLNTELEN